MASDGYVARVADRLDAVIRRAESHDQSCGRVALDVAKDQYIIFSDLHRGARTAADEFRRTERAYRAALAYYLRLGHTLVVLGDAEELWEETPAVVLASYQQTFALEAQFHQRGRYLRIWGNHDDEWQYEPRVRQLLTPIYEGQPLRVYEGVLVEAKEGPQTLGTLFLVHGHQGDRKSDDWSWLSRWVIRYLWRPYQRLTRAKVNTPATSWDLRHKLNQAMYAWAEQQPKLVLIAGHTHSPVFRSLSHEAQLEAQLALLEAEAGSSPSSEQLAAQARLLSRLEWVRTAAQETERNTNGATFAKPCYFNTGCCCYDDGDITGIEIAGGEIRLIRWPDEEGEPRPHILERDSLKDVLAAC
jgi:UDP-2,3-diacylglucosamine pyrophosphatase LpxH